jgi:hypothetical protein
MPHRFAISAIRVGLNYQFYGSDYGFRKSSGSLVKFTAIRRASSFVSSLEPNRLAGDRLPDSFSS